MIPRRLSIGLGQLRPALVAPLAPVPALPAQFRVQSRTLASAVLLSSRENWANKTVKNLKEALSQRGLSQAGKKANLVERLTAYENTTSNTYARAMSSQATKADSEVQTTPSGEEAPKIQVQGDSKVNVSNVVTPVDTPEVEPALAPGLPEARTDFEEAPVTFEIKMPEFEDSPQELAVPPFDPHNFESRAEDSISPPVEIESAAPKVMTVLPTEEGSEGPRHSLHETVSIDEIKVDAAETIVEASEQIKDKAADLPSLTSVLSSISVPSFGLGSIASLVKAPEVEGGQEFKPIERGLDSEEKKGAFILAGIIAAGLYFGGGKKKEEEHEDVKEKVDDAAKKAAK